MYRLGTSLTIEKNPGGKKPVSASYFLFKGPLAESSVPAPGVKMWKVLVLGVKTIEPGFFRI